MKHTLIPAGLTWPVLEPPGKKMKKPWCSSCTGVETGPPQLTTPTHSVCPQCWPSTSQQGLSIDTSAPLLGMLLTSGGEDGDAANHPLEQTVPSEKLPGRNVSNSGIEKWNSYVAFFVEKGNVWHVCRQTSQTFKMCVPDTVHTLKKGKATKWRDKL